MGKKNKDKFEREVDPVKVCRNVFGSFDVFHSSFMSMKFGGVPTAAHPTPSAISKIRKLGDWPDNYRMLRHMQGLCWLCKNKGLIKECHCSLKSMVGECKGFFMEATCEDSRLKAEINKKKK